MNKIDYNDKDTFDLLSRGDTIGVFQLENAHTRKILQQVKPRTIRELADVSALIRPGAKDSGQTDLYIKRRNGEEPISYIHPSLEPILKLTQGIFLYQESIIGATQILAGWSLSKADLMRAAIGKKKIKQMKELIEDFRKDCLTRGIAEDIINQMIEVFNASSRYSFNLAHAISYSLLSYQMAWYKTHYPIAFYYGILKSAINTPKPLDTIQQIYYDAITHNVVIRLPKLGEFNKNFTVVNNEIVWGIDSVKGVNTSNSQTICDIMNSHTDIYEILFALRKDKITKTSIINMIHAGFFDMFIGKDKASGREKLACTFEVIKKITDAAIKSSNSNTMFEASNMLEKILDGAASKYQTSLRKRRKELEEIKAIKRPQHFAAVHEAELLGVVKSILPPETGVIYDERVSYFNNKKYIFYTCLNTYYTFIKKMFKTVEDKKELITQDKPKQY